MRPCSKGLIPSVAAIIRNAQNQVLMIRQHNGGLSLPAGAIERNKERAGRKSS